MNFLIPFSDKADFRRVVSRRLRGWYLDKQADERASGSEIRRFSSYEAFSKYLGAEFGYAVGPKSIENYFRGQQGFSAYALTAICEGLGKSVAEAIYGVDPASERDRAIIEALTRVRDLSRPDASQDPEISELLELYHRLSKKARKLFIAILRGRGIAEAMEEAVREAEDIDDVTSVK